MAATGFTPISLYYTTTAAAVPLSTNLVAGELALNTTDGKLYYKNTAGVVTVLASGGTGSGTVTSVSVVSANGMAGTVATANTTPAITLSTTVTGILKGNGTAISAATAGTDYVTPAGTETLTNKRITARVNLLTTIASPWAWNSDSFDEQAFSALANALTINADAGTPTNGQKTIFRFKDNGTARVLTWTTGTAKSFRAVGITLPATTVINKTLYVGCIYNTTDSRWDAVAVAQEA